MTYLVRQQCQEFSLAKTDRKQRPVSVAGCRHPHLLPAEPIYPCVWSDAGKWQFLCNRGPMPGAAHGPQCHQCLLHPQGLQVSTAMSVRAGVWMRLLRDVQDHLQSELALSGEASSCGLCNTSCKGTSVLSSRLNYPSQILH